MKHVLYIDTSKTDETVVKIRFTASEEVVREKNTYAHSQNLLPLIAKLLVRFKLTLSDVDCIEVNTGPGSFTGVRIGVTVANTLGWVLGISVNRKKQEVPHYSPSKFD